ncbi:MAG: deoxyguanosinetriphosphate triphosphohydrolase [Chloroflexi bacterium]|nr:deoxyguanosinetriphosphate triphosphohydrolase [Chloroflexota bacterium]MDA1146465.1 deoxyguanosinetriphosphate triphosphohydrolase [Chloroflexota bacterium]
MLDATPPSAVDLLSVRQALDVRESLLAPCAARELTSRGRVEPEAPQRLRLAYQLDRDRIIHTRAFRRLKHKTQVFVTPDSDHVVTRMTHTIEVQQIARTIARALNLNEDLTEAIAMGHDLGHTPFGHAGEEELGRLLPDGFRHNEQSLRIVEHLENGGRGLNLMFETRDGILRHSKGRASVTSEEGWGLPATLEGEIVKLSDSIAYLNHDIQDAIRAGLIEERDLPPAARTVLGEDHSMRVETLVTDCVLSSLATFDSEQPTIVLGTAALEATDELRDFMFERVYLHERTLEDAERGQRVVAALFRYYEGQPNEISGWSLPDDPAWRRAADYVSGMTDHYALKRARELGLLD